MNSTIENIKAKAEALKLTWDNEEYDYDSDSNPLIQLLIFGNVLSGSEEVKEFKQWLQVVYKFKWVKNNHDEFPDYDDWSQGNEEEGWAVIQLGETYYKLSYIISSYGSIECDDFWDWKEATPVKKEVTFYL